MKFNNARSMSRMLTLTLFVCLSLNEGTGYAEPNQGSQKAVLKLGELFSEVGIKCPERIWPGFNLKKVGIVFIDTAASDSWIWNSHQAPGRVQKISGAKIKAHPELASDFSFSAIDGQPVMALSLPLLKSDISDYQIDEIFKLGLHESFHKYSQLDLGWPPLNKQSENFHGAFYPSDPKLIYVRKMVFERLRAAFLKPAHRREFLQNAAYWQGQIDTKSPEAISLFHSDIVEGSAHFVETIGAVIAWQGCDTPWPEVRSKIVPVIENKKFYETSGESYVLGTVASLGLIDASTLNWHKKVESGETPTSVLLKGIQIVSDKMIKIFVRKFLLR
jgi:hypothetical protein